MDTSNNITFGSGTGVPGTGAIRQEETANKAQADLRFRLLSQKKITLGNLLESLGNLDPKLHTMLTKGLVMELGLPRYLHIYKQIENWDNPVKVNYSSGEYLDHIATLNKKVEEEGLSVLSPFKDTEICAVNLVCSIKSVAFSFTGFDKDSSRAQLQDIALGRNWKDSIEQFLLNLLPDAPTANTGNRKAIEKEIIGKAIVQPIEKK